jgi:aryl-alcohol dehydrogenase-like predicted oxidoreductase
LAGNAQKEEVSVADLGATKTQANKADRKVFGNFGSDRAAAAIAIARGIAACFAISRRRTKGENFTRNLAPAEKVKQPVKAKGATASQVALAWVLAARTSYRSPPPSAASISPRTSPPLDLELSAAELDRIFPPDAAAGLRHPETFIGSVSASRAGQDIERQPG